MLKALLVVNPNATTTSARTRDVLIHALASDLDLDVVETRHRGHATAAAESAADRRLDVVIAFGGDGTVNEVVNGLLAKGPSDSLPSLAVVPGGSTNVFARAVGLAEDRVEATGQILESLREDRRRSIGLGQADGRWFTFTAGLGLDAEVVAAVDRHRSDGKRSTGRLYLRSAVEEFFGSTERKHGGLTLERAGAEPERGLFLMLVGNCSPWTFLGPLRVDPFPSASFDKGLDVLALRRLGIRSTLRTARQMITPLGGGPSGADVVALHDLSEFTVRAARPVAFQVDGDHLGSRSEVTFRGVPHALRIVV
jgi:diacylglycerol kinase family enzyme